MNSGWFSADGWVNQLFVTLSDWLWTYVLMGVLVVCSLYFTIRSRGVQFTMIREMLRLLTDSAMRAEERPLTASGARHISSFQAFAVSLAARIGTGNLAGVATAITIGGPGSVFWMWVLALLGASMAFVESTLAQLYKRPKEDSYIGGPAYYILHGLHCKWLAVLFAALVPITFGMSFNMIQSNTICDAMEMAFGVNHIVVGCVLAVIALLIVFGGIQRISHVSNIVVPFMAVGYLVIAIIVIGMNITELPRVFMQIIDGAFGIEPVAGGTLGMTIIMGVKRGLFSNEAGEGSTPNVAATAAVTHPVKQGLVQALGVFTDTLVVCSCTAFIILLSGVLTTTSLNGVELTQMALQSQLGGIGPVFIAIAIMLFAFTSILGYTYYGEANIRFVTSNKLILNGFRFISGGVVVVLGSLVSLEMVWNIGDVFMAIVTAVNLVAIVLLSRKAFDLLADYRRQKQQGIVEPTYHNDIDPEVEAWH